MAGYGIEQLVIYIMLYLVSHGALLLAQLDDVI